MQEEVLMQGVKVIELGNQVVLHWVAEKQKLL